MQTTSMSFFTRFGTYNLDWFGRVEYKKNNAKTAKQIWEHMFFMQASGFVIKYLNKNKYCVVIVLSHFVILLCIIK